MGKHYFELLKRASIAAAVVAWPAVAQNGIVTVKSLADNHGVIRSGEVVFSNFQAPTALPYSHPQGALPNDASDIAVTPIVKSDGRVGLQFTAIDNSRGSSKPLFINSDRRSTDPSDLVRNITFDVTASDPARLLHSIGQDHGMGSSSGGDASVANIIYYVEPGTGNAGLLRMDTLNSGPGPVLLPGGDHASFRFGDELEMTSNHNRGGSSGTATIDSFEVTFTLVSTGAQTPAPSPAPSPAPTATAGTALRFVPIAPCRISDTREAAGPFGGPILTGQSSRDFVIPASVCGIPANAVAYSLNATVVPTHQLGWLTLYASGQPQPTVSTLNSMDGRIKANAAIVPAGRNGAVSVFVTDDTHVILDVNGYFAPATNAVALAYYPVTPCRVVDTRGANGPLGGPFLSGGQQREFAVSSSACQIPASARAYSLNFTAVPHESLSYMTVWPSGQQKPLISTLNAPTGGVTANAAIVPAGQGGDINVFATSDTDLVVDVNGYYAPAGPGGLSLYALTPCRVFDSRNEDTHHELEGTRRVSLSNACGVPASARSAVLNATVVPGAALPYLTLWPETEDQPHVSTLNAYDATITSNMAVVPTTTGAINAFTAGSSHVILDTSGYYAP